MRKILFMAMLKRWVPTLLMMGLIFFFSSIPAEQVAEASQPFEAAAQPLLNGINSTLPAAGRIKPDWLKFCHIIGYTGLGLSFRYSLPSPLKRNRGIFVAVIFCALYALLDEFHQSFVPGRSATLKDVGLDTLASASALVLQAVFSRKKGSHGR